ncbi:MAG: endonuclease/exonuclease/phosphatase family protein [Methylococcales bacterium]|nr:EEP domain-containing protein [Methylococcaceae bacterium]
MTIPRLKILTYNLHKGFNASNRRFVLHQIKEALVDTNADVLLLQEMQGEHQKHQRKIIDWPICSHSEFIAEGWWPFYVYGKNVTHSDGHHGNAILSKYPIESWENINVSPYSWASRSLLHAVIRLPISELPVHVVCLHFGLTGAERDRQTQQLCERIDSHVPHDAPLIVAGDFNDWRGRVERHFHEQLGLQEVFQQTHGRYARTFPCWLPILTMDRIYYRGLSLYTCDRLAHSPWPVLSDHAPLTASFTL